MRQLVEHLLKQAKEQGVDLDGPDGLLNVWRRACWRLRATARIMKSQSEA